MNEGPKKNLVHALVLNSPFLELSTSGWLRLVAPSLTGVASALFPYAKLEGAVSPIYPKSLHKEYHGEWDFNLEWKPIAGFPAYFAWIKAIMKAQKRLKVHSNIEVPVLVMHASRSFIPKTYTEEALVADTVLNVKDIARIGPRLGKQVTMMVVKDAMHDIFLSKQEVREHAFQEMFCWLKQVVYAKVY